MCGIAGILHFDLARTTDNEAMAQMIRTMVHRGPDDSGIHQSGPVGFVHRRLSIIDLDAGHQPMYNEDGSVCIVFNGEIYNHEELRKEMQAKEHQFRTRSDTEVIIHCYEEYGFSCVHRLRGMFAFAIWDAGQQKLFLARDRLGIKPLYYYYDQDSFVFASEIKAIIASGHLRFGVNLGALDAYLTLGYVPGPETLFEGIYKLLPGHMIYIKNGSIRIEEYWDFDEIPSQAISEERCSERIRELLDECVRMRLMSDVPVGAFLSGGVDSSAVVAAMSRYVKQVETFSVGYRNAEEQNELNYARLVARKFGAKHHEFILEPTDFFESISELLFYLEEPIVEPAAIALFHLSRLAREHVTVLLSGEGADEIFGGYAIYQKMQILTRIRRMVPVLRSSLTTRGLSLLLKPNENLQKHLDWLRLTLEERYSGVSCDLTGSIKQRLYSGDLRSICQENHIIEKAFHNYYQKVEHRDDLGKMLYVDAKIWLPDDLLTKADKMTMANSVELRVPFLDHKFVEFAASIPSILKIKGQMGKYILKKAMKGILTDAIVYRTKLGFPVPINQWFNSDLYSKAAEVLLDRKALNRGYFNKAYLTRMLEKHRDGKIDYSRRIFSLLVLEFWHQSYIDLVTHGNLVA